MTHIAFRLGVRRFLADRDGVGAVEFALTLPVLMLLALGIAEVGRATLLSLKLQHAATSLADLAARDETLSSATLTDLMASSAFILKPFAFKTAGVAIVSAVGKDADKTAKLAWQQAGGGSLTATSSIGTAGGGATLPDGMTPRDGETLIVAETFFRYDSWLLGLVPSRVIRHVAYYRPRLGTLRALS